MKVLISGISGQAGSFLAELYLEKGWEVHGFIRQRSDLSFLSAIKDKLHLHLQDIRDPHGVWATIKDGQFDVIHSLAAMTWVPYSWVNPLDTFQTNVDATINILQAVKTDSPHTVLHFAGSSEEYGALSRAQTPIVEDTIPVPASPYGVSKYAGDLLMQQYNRSAGLKTVITRAFNHESVRRGDQFVSTQVVKQALEIKHHYRKSYSLGNLDSVRDYTDARDMVRAYYMAANRDRPHDSPRDVSGVKYGVPYNVCSGEGHTVRELVNIVNGLIGFDPDIPEIEKDPARLRPSDIPVMVGNPERFVRATGWQPRYTFQDMLEAMIDGLEAKLYP